MTNCQPTRNLILFKVSALMLYVCTRLWINHPFVYGEYSINENDMTYENVHTYCDDGSDLEIESYSMESLKMHTNFLCYVP